MKTKDKDLYEPPTMSVVEIKTQGVLCWSTQNVMIILGIEGGSSDDTFGVPDYTGEGAVTWN